MGKYETVEVKDVLVSTGRKHAWGNEFMPCLQISVSITQKGGSRKRPSYTWGHIDLNERDAIKIRHEIDKYLEARKYQYVREATQK